MPDFEGVDTDNIEVLVVGAGNAALCAAISASENGAKAVMIESEQEQDRGTHRRRKVLIRRFILDRGSARCATGHRRDG